MPAVTNIPGLPAGIALNGTEALWAVQNGRDVRLTALQVSAYIQATPLAALSFTTPLVRTANNVTLTTVPVNLGGTGVTTLAQNGVLFGNVAAPLGVTAAGTTGQVLIGNTGGAPSWSSTIPATAGVSSFSGGTTGLTPSAPTTGAIVLSGTLAVLNGGTGVTTSTGTGSVVLSAGPTLTGTTVIGANSSVNGVADGSAIFFVKGLTNLLRIIPQVAGLAIESTNFGQSAYAPLILNGISTTLQANGVNVVTVQTGSVTIAQSLIYGGVTLANSVTGTGSMVLSASPTLTGVPIMTVGDVAPAPSGVMNTGLIIQVAASSRALNIGTNNTGGYSWINAAFANNSNVSDILLLMTGAVERVRVTSAAITITPATILSAALTYGGVTLANSVTGTGSMVLSASPALTGTLTVPSINLSPAGAIPAAMGWYNNTTVLTARGGSAGYALVNNANTANILTVSDAGVLRAIAPNLTSVVSVGAFRSDLAFCVILSNDGSSGNSTLATVGGGATLTLQAGGVTIATLASALVTIAQPLNYGGVTLANSVTGTGSMVLSTSPTITTPSITGPNITGTVNGAATYNSPTLVTPALGTPASGNLVNCTGFPGATTGNGTTFLLTTNMALSTVSPTSIINTGSIGASGQVWLIMAVLCFFNTATAAVVTGEIYDGTAVVATNEATSPALNQTEAITFMKVVTLSGATTFTLRGLSNNANSFARRDTGNTTVTDKTTSITAVRIA